MYLNSDDLHDPELAMIRSRIMGGTLVMWATHLDPFVTVHQPASSSATALILQIPGYNVSIHVAIYLPTSGKENDFISDLTHLRISIMEFNEEYPGPIIFIRGDSNVNKNNRSRTLLFKQLLDNLCLLQVHIYHIFHR